MIDGEPECLTSKDESKPKLMNLQTQHGSEETDLENIILLARSCSPVRETSEQVVWHEELVKYGDEDDAVS